MASTSNLTPALADKIRDLLAQGKSVRTIARDVSVPRQTLSRWIKGMGIEAGPVGRQPTKPKPAKRAKPKAGPEPIPAELPPPPSSDDPIELLRGRHAQIARILTSQFDSATTGKTSLSTYKGLAELEIKYAAAIDELSPKPPPDPELDPTSQEAARTLARRLDGLVEAAERSTVCVHCGRHPFVTGTP